MSSNRLLAPLAISISINVGVIAAVGVQVAAGSDAATARHDERGHRLLADYLRLNAEQRARWNDKEERFMERLAQNWTRIRAHRREMVEEIFSDTPDPLRIEAHRQRIARLQEAQQKDVIAQLLAERDILDEGQRRKLADLLIGQNPAGSLGDNVARQLHGN